MAIATIHNSITQNGTVIYLNNKELLAEVKRCKKAGCMTDTLARMLQLLCAKYAKKGSFVNYSYNEDMQAFAMMMLLRTWNAFDPEKGSNPFAFFTQCIKNSFIQYLKHEKRQRDVKDLLMIGQGLNPSYGYDSGEKDNNGIVDEQDFDTITKTAEATSRYQYVETIIDRDDKGREIERELPDLDTEPDIELPPEVVATIEAGDPLSD